MARRITGNIERERQLPKIRAQHPSADRKCKPIDGMALFDNYMFSAALDGHNEAVAEILRVVLDDPKLEVQSVKPQYYIGNIGKGSVLLDILALDGQGRHLNVEFQRDNRDAGADRAIYHFAALATHLAREHGRVGLPVIYIIFFTEHDYWGHGQAMYEIENRLTVNGDGKAGMSYPEVPDRLHIRYVNGEARKDTATLIGKLLHDLFCLNSRDMFFPNLAKALYDCKETEEGRRRVDRLIEAYKMMGADDCRAEVQRRTAANFLAMGLSPEQVAQGAELPIEEVRMMAEARKGQPPLR